MDAAQRKQLNVRFVRALMHQHNFTDRALVGGVRMDDPDLVRQVEECWILINRLGLKYADLAYSEDED
jgi:hypothetical protein